MSFVTCSHLDTAGVTVCGSYKSDAELQELLIHPVHRTLLVYDQVECVCVHITNAAMGTFAGLDVLHMSASNTTDLVRLSCDTRWQPADEPVIRGWRCGGTRWDKPHDKI